MYASSRQFITFSLSSGISAAHNYTSNSELEKYVNDMTKRLASVKEAVEKVKGIPGVDKYLYPTVRRRA